MKRVGVVIGVENGDNKFKKFKKRYPKIIKNVPKDQWVEYDDSQKVISHDVIILACLRSLKQNKYEFVPLSGSELTLKDLNSCDFVYSIYELGWVYEAQVVNGGIGVKKYEEIMRKTRAKIIPSFKFQNSILKKHIYMQLLKKHKIPHIPTYYIDINRYAKNKNKELNNILNHIEKNEYKKVLFKTEFTGFGKNVMIMQRFKKEAIRKYLDGVRKAKIPGVLLQPFIKEFSETKEYRLFFIGGKLFTGIGQRAVRPGELIEPKDTASFSHLNRKELAYCKKLGARVVAMVKKEFGMVPPLMRLDFGCCIDGVRFLNEIEFSPTINVDEQNLRLPLKIAEEVLKSVKVLDKGSKKKSVRRVVKKRRKTRAKRKNIRVKKRKVTKRK